MFGSTISPGVDVVRILALSGKRGKPPCLWEGPPSTTQSVIEAQMASDKRIVRWLRKNRLIQNDSATLSLQIDMFSQGKRVDSATVADATILVSAKKKQKKASDEIALRAFDMTENMVHLFQKLLSERDTVIGRLVERGLKQNDPSPLPIPELPKSDFLSEFLEKGTQFVSMAKAFRELKE